MKYLFTLVIAALSLSTFAVENLHGKFTLNNKSYDFQLTYNISPKQEASDKSVHFFAASTIPERGFEVPAYCAYNVVFNVPYKITITNSLSGDEVYSHTSLASFNSNAGGGLLSEGKCNWTIDGWTAVAPAHLRINEHSFLINKQYYRFVLDTQALLWLSGVGEATVFIEGHAPQKGTDGKKDGEVWLDTMPDQNGKYTRTWFPLKF